MADGSQTKADDRGSPRCRHCGGLLRQRSDAEHNLFFAVVAQAWETWPERVEFQPTSDDHLRGWLLIEVGHSLSADLDGPANITVRNLATLRHLLRSLDTASDTALVAMRLFETKTGVRVVIPKSMKRRVIGKREFEDVANKVFDLIEALTGTSVDEFKGMAKKGTP